MTMPAKMVIPDESIIKVIAADYGLVGEVKVTNNKGFSVGRVTEEHNRIPLEKRLNEILAQTELPISVPVPGMASGVKYLKKGDELYHYAVADALSHHRIANLVVRGEVVENKDYSGN